MRREFIVTLFDCFLSALYYLNVVEYVKKISVLIYRFVYGRKLSDEDKRAASGIGIDVYQIVKFAAIVALLSFGIQGLWAEYLTYYLIASNAFTYFYYHAWGSRFIQQSTRDDQRRRLLNFLLAIVFYILCYAYLYQHHFALFIEWPEGRIDTTT